MQVTLYIVSIEGCKHNNFWRSDIPVKIGDRVIVQNRDGYAVGTVLGKVETYMDIVGYLTNHYPLKEIVLNIENELDYYENGEF